MNKWCLITGASAGIGKELAFCFAKNNYNLVLIARTTSKLTSLSQAIKNKYNVETIIISKDLSKIDSACEIKKELVDKEILIHTLVNNAGIGYAGSFDQISYQQNSQMNQINIIALNNLCHLFIQDMKKQGEGQILNIASTAAFQPGPFMAAYYAGKSFVLNYSLAIREELKNKNIKVTCLCPGATKTNFFNNETFNFSSLDKIPWISQPSVVAKRGYLGLIQNKAIVIPGLINSLMAFFVKFIPYPLLLKIISKINNT